MYSTTELTEQTRLQSNISIFSNDREYHNVDRLKTVVDHALHLIGKEQYVLLTLFVIVSEYIYFLQSIVCDGKGYLECRLYATSNYMATTVYQAIVILALQTCNITNTPFRRMSQNTTQRDRKSQDCFTASNWLV